MLITSNNNELTPRAPGVNLMAIMIIISIRGSYYSIISFNYAHNYVLYHKINNLNVRSNVEEGWRKENALVSSDKINHR